jgi:hypothetical protein
VPETAPEIGNRNKNYPMRPKRGQNGKEKRFQGPEEGKDLDANW